jgi:hypothetical protein
MSMHFEKIPPNEVCQRFFKDKMAYYGFSYRKLDLKTTTPAAINMVATGAVKQPSISKVVDFCNALAKGDRQQRKALIAELAELLADAWGMSDD